MNVNKININQTEPTYNIASNAYDITYENSNVGEKLTNLNEKIDALALGTFYGFFPNSSSLPTNATTLGYAYVGLDNPYEIWNFKGKSWSDSGTSIDMNVDADEEDITRNRDGKLQFKNRAYGDGMGYVILRKDKSFAEQMTKENTIYEIRYDFTLGKNVTIPNNCVLKFDGGSITNNASNVLIINDNSFVIDAPVGVKIFNNIRFSQGHPRIIHTSWWGIKEGEQSDNDFEYLLNCISYNLSTNSTRSILCVDNDIVLSRHIEARLAFAEISGYATGGYNGELQSFVKISYNKEATYDGESIIKLNVQEVNIHNICFAWYQPSNASINYLHSILELYPLIPDVGDNLDATVTNCGFYSSRTCSAIKTTGRGLTVSGCGFTILGGDSVHSNNVCGVIRCVTGWQEGDNDFGTSPEDQMRRIKIYNNGFHCGRYHYAVSLISGTTEDTSKQEDLEKATFKGLVFRGNTLDRGTRAIYCRARTSGILVSNNIFLFVDCTDNYGIISFYVGSAINGCIFSNNIITLSGHNMDNDSYYKPLTVISGYCIPGKNSIKNIIVTNNSFNRIKLNRFIWFDTYIMSGSDFAEVIGLNISNNVFSNVKEDGSLLYINGRYNKIENLIIKSNSIEHIDSNACRPFHSNVPSAFGTTYKHIRISDNIPSDSRGIIFWWDNNQSYWYPQDNSKFSSWVDLKATD